MVELLKILQRNMVCEYQNSPKMDIIISSDGNKRIREIRKPAGGTKFRITDEDREIMLSILFNDPNIFGYISRNTCWSLRSLATCLTEERIWHSNQSVS